MSDVVVPTNILNFTQSKRVELVEALLHRDNIATQDPKVTSVGVKVLRDMDSADVSMKRLQLDNKVAGDDAALARELIQATYNNMANGVQPYVNPNPDAAPRQFDMPDDILPGFVPNEEIMGVGVADRTYDEVVTNAPPK
jgi:hypothetical protein